MAKRKLKLTERYDASNISFNSIYDTDKSCSEDSTSSYEINTRPKVTYESFPFSDADGPESGTESDIQSDIQSNIESDIESDIQETIAAVGGPRRSPRVKQDTAKMRQFKIESMEKKGRQGSFQKSIDCEGAGNSNTSELEYVRRTPPTMKRNTIKIKNKKMLAPSLSDDDLDHHGSNDFTPVLSSTIKKREEDGEDSREVLPPIHLSDHGNSNLKGTLWQPEQVNFLLDCYYHDPDIQKELSSGKHRELHIFNAISARLFERFSVSKTVSSLRNKLSNLKTEYNHVLKESTRSGISTHDAAKIQSSFRYFDKIHTAHTVTNKKIDYALHKTTVLPGEAKKKDSMLLRGKERSKTKQETLNKLAEQGERLVDCSERMASNEEVKTEQWKRLIDVMENKEKRKQEEQDKRRRRERRKEKRYHRRSR